MRVETRQGDTTTQVAGLFPTLAQAQGDLAWRQTDDWDWRLVDRTDSLYFVIYPIQDGLLQAPYISQ